MWFLVIFEIATRKIFSKISRFENSEANFVVKEKGFKEKRFENSAIFGNRISIILTTEFLGLRKVLFYELFMVLLGFVFFHAFSYDFLRPHPE